MSLERIRETILSKARQEAEGVLSDARKRHEAQLAAARDSLQKEFAARLERAKQQARQECDREAAHKRSQHNLALLKLRNSILNDVFDDAAQRLLALPDDEYRQYVRLRMGDVPAELGGELLCKKSDEKRLAPLVEEMNKARPVDAQLKLIPGDTPALGGVILRTQKFELDLSLDTQLAQLRDELAPEVAKGLFPHDVTL